MNTNEAINVNVAASPEHGAKRHILLATALITGEGPYGEKTILRALVDQGSEGTFITEEAAQRLRLKGLKTYVRVCGIGNSKECIVRKIVGLTIHSHTNDGFSLRLQALVLHRLTGTLPPSRISTGDWAHLEGITLADLMYWEPKNVDMILGADVFSEILLPGIRKGVKGSPIAQQTTLGWILSGESSHLTRKVHVLHCSVCTDSVLRAFWEIEEVSPERKLTREEEQCENFFRATFHRSENGRYIVRLPFNTENGKPDLGGSREMAVNQLLQMERRFTKDPELFRPYAAFMKEYLELSHMVPVFFNDDDEGKSSKFNYLPHHAVRKDSSTTTKLRVVFDASRKTSNGRSLNDNLLVGPSLQDDLFIILLRWRKYPVVFIADVKQMYRQIKVHDDDVNYQRIVWRENPQQPISDYQLTTVTYGTACAPFLAIRTIRQLAEDEKDKYPLGAKLIHDNMYVDDAIVGCDTVSEALQAQKEMKQLLREGGFELRKWASNRSELLENLSKEEREMDLPLEFNNDKIIKTLGVNWNPAADSFEYKVRVSIESPTTKRKILSQIARIFDPLGWLAPVIIVAKILIQRLWLAGVSWDEQLSGELLRSWEDYIKRLHELETIKVPRWIGLKDRHTLIEFHGFCDASMDAYAACIYIKIIFPEGQPKISLLTSKTRVAPVKKITLPRLELCGAVLLAKLVKYIMAAFKDDNINTHAWTDSQIVLAWLRGNPNRWKPFVSNRVEQVLQTLNSSQWHYVSTNDNPADCASRGLTPDKLRSHPTWWTGPSWLNLAPSQWPTFNHRIENTNMEERKVKLFKITKAETEFYLLNKYSSISKLIRITAYCQRFMYNARRKPPEDVKVRCPLKKEGRHYDRMLPFAPKFRNCVMDAL